MFEPNFQMNIKEVIFVCLDDENYEIYEEILEREEN